jgi:cell division protein FtsQ
VGTGTRSRKAAESHHLQEKVEGSALKARDRDHGQAKKGSSKRRTEANRRRELHSRMTEESRLKREERELRRIAARRVQRTRVLVVAAAVLAVSALWIGLSSSTAFEITSVEVTGTDVLDPASVEASAAVPAGATLLRLPASDIEARVRANPWVEDVKLRRDFPSTLRIEIVERVPFALVDTGAAFWSVDAAGLVLGQATFETTTSPLVVIRDIPGLEPVPGVVSTADALKNALSVLRGIAPGIAATVTAVSAPSVNETVLVTSTGVEIMIGEAVQLDEKSALVTSILTEQGERVVFVDVRSIERPISRGLGE